MLALFSLSPLEILILLPIGLLLFGVPLALVLIFVVFRKNDRPAEPGDDDRS